MKFADATAAVKRSEDLERGPWFSAQVVADSYEWQEAEGGPFLVETEGRGVFGTSFAARLYSPLVRPPVAHRDGTLSDHGRSAR